MEPETQTTFWQWILNQNSITFIIAVVGFAISIYNFIIGIIQNSTRLKIEFPHVYRFENSSRCIEIMHVKIYNLSKIPVVVSRVTVHNSSTNGAFGSYRKRVLDTQRRVGNRIVDTHEWISDVLPTKIEGNGCANLLLVADNECRVFDTFSRNKIRIHTAKKPLTRSLTLANFADSELLSQCREPSC